MTSSYFIIGPALISFSGGRTSAYMLHKILEAHNGALPADVVVAFANTGREREETLRFVHECESRWDVPIYWVEFRDAAEGFERVGYNSAARKGEPFSALIRKKKRLPNWQERWCSQYLKVTPLQALAEHLGFAPGQYSEIIGLRDDEGMRIFRGLEDAEKTGRRVVYPLARAKVCKADIMTFWSRQPFDLKLQPWEGNCDLCFMKGRGIRKRIIRQNPARANWWAEQEDLTGGSFDRRDMIADLVGEIRRAPDLFDPVFEEEHDAECGLLCAAEAAE
ncbi:phosphoadenosine phosphosulfate reductase family protein [Ensifer sp. LC163]|uniref:phosphoadenosine phosphosulfate reductase domain-containing protein n=1 Tax=Ensifer sp. LC163 TaxID=1120652 RepID=UPI0008138726|nr:phosphoadenosine phosphosulfate reductase family protein [Ensifer sp. LC163]OCP36750.1 hypothetical protein BC360_05190 [Ensifer sp. LC163]